MFLKQKIYHYILDNLQNPMKKIQTLYYTVNYKSETFQAIIQLKSYIMRKTEN